MIKRDDDGDADQKVSTIKIEAPLAPIQPIVRPAKEEILSDISPEFLVKSEQLRIKKKEKHNKFKHLYKDHRKVLKLMDDEEKALMDVVKRKTLELAEQLEYEDEYDDFELELTKHLSKPTNDVTEGMLD
jgi:hypothetical protein